MKLSLTLCSSLLVSGIASGSAQELRGGRDLVFAQGGGGRGRQVPRPTFTAIHEVHQYEQVKFFDEPMWRCSQEDVGDNVGCIRCFNPGEVGDDGLIVEVKSIYKRPNRLLKDEDANPPRKHCVWPRRGFFWTCFNTNQVIEPDTDWLGSFSDKPIYDENGEVVPENDDGERPGAGCLPGSIVANLPDNGATFF